MKISEMKTAEHQDELFEIIDIIDDIISDTEFVNHIFGAIGYLSNKEQIKNEDIILLVWAKRKIIVKTLLKSKFEQAIKLTSIIIEKPVEEIKAQTSLQTLSDMYNAFNDKALFDFFKSQVETK